MQVKLNLSGHKNPALEALGFDTHILHVDLADTTLASKVTEFLRPLVDSDSVVTVALPGLAPLSAIVISVLHGLTGQFPTVQPLVRNADGGFEPGPLLDLQTIRNDTARTTRDGLTIL